jgi:hypothetical protein
MTPITPEELEAVQAAIRIAHPELTEAQRTAAMNLLCRLLATAVC